MELDKINIFDSKPPTPQEILAAGPGAIAAPLSPAELMEIEKSQLSSDPVIRKLQKVGRGIGSLFEVETPLDYALSGLAAAKPVVAAGKGIAAVAKTAKEADPKDLVFVHNTSEEAIKSFDNMGGIPSPSIAVTKADQPFTGFGKIQLIGKPEKFDPLIDPRNKIYSADAYSPRAPKKIRLAKEGAVDQFKKDYINADQLSANRNIYNRAIEGLEKLNKTRGANILENESANFDIFFDSDVAKIKFYEEIGRDPADLKNKPFPQIKYNRWVNEQKDKYLSQDGVFTYFDDFESTMVSKPYTLDNVVENMVQETQRGGEGGLGMFGANRLRALMSERFESLADIKNRKEMLTKNDPPVNDLFDDVEVILEDVDPYLSDMTEDILTNIGESLKAGEKNIESIVKNSLIGVPETKQAEVTKKIANSLRLNAMRPVEYFEAKPTRAVGFDEFAGAIVGEGTSKEVIDILEKNGLKVIKQSMDDLSKDYGKGKARQAFKDQFFSIAPITAAASATAMIDSQDQGIGSL